MDNHSSHLTVPAIDFARENGIVMATFPPHCSHRLQPLDRGVYGPLKKYVNTEADCWMRNNPGKNMSIYDIPGIIKIALPKACNPQNIMGGFKSSGIVPFSPDTFDDDDFAPAILTDRPNPFQEAEEQTAEAVIGNAIATFGFSPDDVSPLQVAPPRKGTGRRKGHSGVVTDTPERNAIAALAEKKKRSNPKKKRLYMGRGKNKENRPKRSQIPATGANEKEWHCTFCAEPYSSSKANEEWLECCGCKDWAHLKCLMDVEWLGPDDDYFYCPNCHQS